MFNDTLHSCCAGCLLREGVSMRGADKENETELDVEQKTSSDPAKESSDNGIFSSDFSKSKDIAVGLNGDTKKDKE